MIKKTALTAALGILTLSSAIGILTATQSTAQAQTTFTSNYSVTIEAGTTGGTAQLNYEYTGSASLTTCTSHTETLTIPNNTQVTRTGTVSLINVPSGTTEQCEYTATIENLPAGLTAPAPRANIDASDTDVTLTVSLSSSILAGNGIGNNVAGDAPADAWNVVYDTTVEFIPMIFMFMAAFIAVVITLMLVRRGIRKVRGMIVSTGTT